jgi:hypothetical protein
LHPFRTPLLSRAAATRGGGTPETGHSPADERISPSSRALRGCFGSFCPMICIKSGVSLWTRLRTSQEIASPNESLLRKRSCGVPVHRLGERATVKLASVNERVGNEQLADIKNHTHQQQDPTKRSLVAVSSTKGETERRNQEE